MEPIIYTNYIRPDSKGEPGGGKKIVEPQGSIPVKEQVESMILAGRRLTEARAAQYDYDVDTPDPEEIEIDPTRSGTFDLADASYLGHLTEQKLKEQAKAAEYKAKIAAEKEQAEKIEVK